MMKEMLKLRDLKTTKGGLPGDINPNILVTKVEEQSKYGKDYKDCLYRIEGSEDLIRLRTYDDSSSELILERGYFKNRREYATKVGELSREFQIPFKISLAIGDKREDYVSLKQAIADVDNFQISTLRDLRAGIYRRKKALKEILGERLYDSIGIEDMGQEHSERIAHYIWDRCMSRVNN